MRLNHEDLVSCRQQWLLKGYSLPEYSREAMIEKTKAAPVWIHFGNGNIFRAFQANIVQKLLNENIMETGLIAAEGYDEEIIENVSRPHDDYSILVTLKADGNVEKTVIGSVAETLILDCSKENEFVRLKEIFSADTLQLASFTITEKGYKLTDANGNIADIVSADFKTGPKRPKSYIGKVTALLYARFKAGGKPIAMVSMDNCSHNGDKLFEAVLQFVRAWTSAGFCEPAFEAYVSSPDKVSFPWTMIDKITPRPDNAVMEMLQCDGVEEISPEVTSKNTYIAPFVNAEKPQYLVIEDNFPNGRPPLEKAGVIFADRQAVEKTEKMKVCTCLNPLHTALAVFGCLLGYKKISDEMDDACLKKLVFKIGYEEGLPVVVHPGIIEPKAFIDEVINERIPNPFMPDTPQRIATDTSQKMGVRFGETIKAYMAKEDKNMKNLQMIPLVIAGWLRYLMGIDDEGKDFEVSPDPLYGTLKTYVSDIKLGNNELFDLKEAIIPVLTNTHIFGVNLYEAGLGEKITAYFSELTAGKGAVRRTLEKYVGEM